MIHLYHFWSSTCSRKVRICLAEKGIEWSSHHVDIVEKRENTEEWYVDINPKGVVPTLVYNDQIIIESNIIIEFLPPIKPGIDRKKFMIQLQNQMKNINLNLPHHQKLLRIDLEKND